MPPPHRIPGSFTREASGVVKAMFVFNNVTYEFVATLAATLDPFTTNNINLTFSGDVDDLVGYHHITGYIGDKTFSVDIKDDYKNTKITGDINPLFYTSRVQVSGFGVWERVKVSIPSCDHAHLNLPCLLTETRRKDLGQLKDALVPKGRLVNGSFLVKRRDGPLVSYWPIHVVGYARCGQTSVLAFVPILGFSLHCNANAEAAIDQSDARYGITCQAF